MNKGNLCNCTDSPSGLTYYSKHNIMLTNLHRCWGCMSIKRESLEYEALAIMAKYKEPIGSSALNFMLQKIGFDASAATVGRLLSDFDDKGMTVKQGYRGRLITERGLSRLKELDEKLKWQDLSAKLYNTLDSQSKDNLIDVLTARRGIEREIARLAAIKATPEDIKSINEAFNMQLEKAAKGILTFESDLLFHRSIANASKNKVLAAAYEFIWQNGKYSNVMEYIRNYVGGKIVTDHGKILDAIVNGNPHEAEQAMVEHIESLISDVDEYWNVVL